jgi:DNA helicase-2/ATP-dependent DNA helicase PcrA
LAKSAKAKTKSENQPISSGDCRQAIHWYSNLLADETNAGLGFGRGLFATNFETDDQLLLDTTLANLESKGIKPFVITGSDIYKQSDYLWNLALKETNYGRPVVSKFEKEIADSQFLVINNLDTPLIPTQLWYLYHHILYPRALVEKPVLISTPLGFEEFVMYGAGCEDFEYAGRRITWEKLVSLLNAMAMNLYHCKQLQQENLPAMLVSEYRLYRALQERHLSVTPHHIFNGHLFDLGVIDDSAKFKLNIECDFIHRFGLLGQSSNDLTNLQTKRDKEVISSGWQVLRFSAKEIAGSLDSCVDAVEELQRNNSKKSSVGRSVNLPMLSVSINLPVKDKDELNAITHDCGPAAIVGGAGTGKSTCIAQRILFLLGQGVSPERILVLSYSAETIKPLKIAAEKIMPGRLLDKVNFYSWHDLGMRILKENVLAIKRKLPLKIESSPQKILQKLIAKYTKESDQTALEIEGHLDEEVVLKIIVAFKANLIGVQAVKDSARNERDQLIAKVYAAYEEQLQKANKIDKDDVISLAAQTLGQEVEVRTRYENLFEHIIVDEEQDTTIACDFIARILACPNDNIIFVGNPNESIHESENASPYLITQTSLRLPNAKCYVLNRNWRAHPQITKHAEQFADNAISGGKNFFGNQTITGWGDVPTEAIIGAYQFDNESTQMNWLLQNIDELIAKGRRPEEIAIICRSKNQSSQLESLLAPKGLLATGGDSDTSQLPDEETDVLTFLKLISDPDGPKAREYFERVCQLRLKAISPKLSATITDVAEGFNVSYLKAVEFYSEAAADPFATQLEQLVKRIRSMHRDKLSAYEIINLLKRPQWLGDYYKSIKLPPRVNYEPLKAMSQVQEEARTYKTVTDFLKNYSPAKTAHQETESAHSSLNVLTITEAKGREFQVVFLPDLVEGIYPKLDQVNQNEEARIFYVALTRAREFLYLSCTKKMNNNLCKPSPYLAQAGLQVIESGPQPNVIEVSEESAIDFNLGQSNKVLIEDEIIIEEVIAPASKVIEAEIIEEVLLPTLVEPVVPSAPPVEQIKKITPAAKSAPIVEEPMSPAQQTSSWLVDPEIKAQVQPELSPEVKPEVKPKSTNIFGLIKENTGNEIIDEFAATANKKTGLDFSEAVQKVRKAQQIQNDEEENISKSKASPPKKPKIKSTIEQNQTKCINCQSPIDPQEYFCGECGAEQIKVNKNVCVSCGHILKESEKFCGECGSPR